MYLLFYCGYDRLKKLKQEEPDFITDKGVVAIVLL